MKQLNFLIQLSFSLFIHHFVSTLSTCLQRNLDHWLLVSQQAKTRSEEVIHRYEISNKNQKIYRIKVLSEIRWELWLKVSCSLIQLFERIFLTQKKNTKDNAPHVWVSHIFQFKFFLFRLTRKIIANNWIYAFQFQTI